MRNDGMDYRFLGRTGVRVSKLVFGTMSFGGDADEATSKAMYGRVRDAGINTFDCADVYNGGRSERILGELIRDHRDDVVITTKSYFPTSKDPNARGSSRFHIVRAVEASLKRLGVDYVDVFFLHRYDDVTALEETMRAVDDLVRQGKVLYVGASNFSAWQTMKAQGIANRDRSAPIVCTQPMYNLAKRQAEVEILPMALSEGIGVMSYSPLGGGLLSGKYRGDQRPSSGRLIKNPMYQTRYGDAENYAIADRLYRYAGEAGHHPAALAVAWVAAHSAMTAPIIGARNLDQLEPVLGATSIDMTDEMYAAIGALSDAPPPATDRNEERSAHNYGAR